MMDKISKIILFCIALAIIGAIIFAFIPAYHGNTCVPENSFWDPSGMVKEILTPQEDILYTCGQAFTPYTSPLFYFFIDISVLIALFFLVRWVRIKDKISAGFCWFLYIIFIILIIYLLLSIVPELLGRLLRIWLLLNNLDMPQ
jgi:hypothetical protein